MNRWDALQVLDLEEGATPEEVRAAFAVMVKASHPDTRGMHVGPQHTMATLQKARNLLLNTTVSQNNACKLCRGAGIVKSRIGATRCVACRGTGERQ